MSHSDHLSEEEHIQKELRLCGTMIENTVSYLVEKKVSPDILASALLGSSLMVLSRTMNKSAMVRLLEQALENVKNDAVSLDKGVE